MASRRKIFKAMDEGLTQYVADTVTYRDRESGELNVERPTPICDFCCSREAPIKWSYPCGLVPIAMNPLMDFTKTPWAACDPCHAFIEAGDVSGLVQHSLQAQMLQVGLTAADLPDSIRGEVEAHLREHFGRFQDARRGPAVPEGEFNPRTGEPNGNA